MGCINEINGHTKLTGLLGSPVAHSKSPLMHNEAFKELGLNYVYLCFDVPENNLKVAYEGLKKLNVAGFNCTMPDKTLICELLDELSPAASMIGAVNTVVNKDGKFIGHNTDGIGYMQSVKDAGFDIIGDTMTLLGAGGAASSIFVTNATSVGMAPNVDGCIIPDKKMLREDLIVSDVIYNPMETKLLRMAKEQGCQTFNGLYMLLYQGAEAFKIWTGKDMPVEHIKELYFTV